MIYQVIIEIPTIISIEAKNETEAIEKVKDNLIKSNQIKPADQFRIFVAEQKNN